MPGKKSHTVLDIPNLKKDEYLDTIMDAQEFVTEFLLSEFEKGKNQ